MVSRFHSNLKFNVRRDDGCAPTDKDRYIDTAASYFLFIYLIYYFKNSLQIRPTGRLSSKTLNNTKQA